MPTERELTTPCLPRSTVYVKLFHEREIQFFEVGTSTVIASLAVKSGVTHPSCQTQALLDRSKLRAMLQLFLDFGPVYAALLFFVIYLGYGVLQATLDPLRHIPGPLIARFTRLWYVWHIYKGRVHYTNIGLHKKYGPIVRLAPKLYSIDDVEAAKTIYGSGTRFVKVKAPTFR